MNAIKRFFYFMMFTLVAAMLGGCATAPEIYYPTLPPGITTIEAAKEDLATLLKTPIRIYCWDAGCIYGEKDKASVFIPGIEKINYSKIDGRVFFIEARSLPVYSDRVDIPFYPLFFEDMLEPNFNLVVERYPPAPPFIELPSRISLSFSDYASEPAKFQRIVDDLFFIQQALKKQREEQLTLFASKAARYRALNVKPSISEEQRKYVVQANAFNQEQNYVKAIELFNKAIEVDPVSYPGAYFNMALLSAQLGKFNKAIFTMKQYLMLVPDAPDARGAQDKIYEWEAKIQK